MRFIRSLYLKCRQLLKFSLVGILNTIIDFGVFALITFFFSKITQNSDALIYIFIANAISLFAWVTNSYFVNRKWTFEQTSPPHFGEAVKFYLINSISFFVSTGIIYLLCRYIFPPELPFGKVLAKICAAPVVIFINFLGSKHFAFETPECVPLEKE